MGRGLPLSWRQRSEDLRLSAHSCQVPHVLPRHVDPSLARRREEALDARRTQLRAELGQLSTQLSHFLLRTKATPEGVALPGARLITSAGERGSHPACAKSYSSSNSLWPPAVTARPPGQECRFRLRNLVKRRHANGSSEVVANGHSCDVSVICASVISTLTPHCRAPGVIHTLLSHNLGAKVVDVQSSGSVVLSPPAVQKLSLIHI